MNLSKLQLIQNPVSDKAYFVLQDIKRIPFSLHNMVGTLLYHTTIQRNRFELDMSAFPNSLYLGQFYQNGQRKTFKIFKQN